MVADDLDRRRTDLEPPLAIFSAPGRARPAERYGSPAPWLRWLTVLLVVAMALSGSAWLLWAALYHSSPQVSSRLLRASRVDEHRIDVTIAVERTATVEATCRVRAQAADSTIVGDLTFTVPPSAETSVIVQRSMTTERRAVSVAFDGCTTPEQPRPR